MLTVSALTSRRQTLSSHLLASIPSSPLLAPQPPVTLGSLKPSQRLSALRERHKRQWTTSLHRISIPVSSFAARDPSPTAPNKGRVLGVRFENYSARTRQFGIPYYILLNQPWLDSNERVRKELQVHRHSFPAWVDIERLARKYLPVPEQEAEQVVESDPEETEREDRTERKKVAQDLPELIRELRRRLTSYQRREDSLLRLDEARSVRKVTFVDAERMEGTLLMKDGGLTTIALDEAGNISGVHITDEHGRRNFNREREWKEKAHVGSIQV